MPKIVSKVVIFGNSGSGKSTLARELMKREGLAHLDLDTLAWRKESPTARRPIPDSLKDLRRFMAEHSSWVIEGCYSSLLETAISQCTRLDFLNPGMRQCVENCRARSWEPHKYSSPEAQARNLDMLIEWVKNYESKVDEFSLDAHRRLFDEFEGEKTEFNSNTRDV